VRSDEEIDIVIIVHIDTGIVAAGPDDQYDHGDDPGSDWRGGEWSEGDGPQHRDQPDA
jgi:hypothetical protein